MAWNPWRGVPGVRRSYALRFGAALVVVLLIVGAFGGIIYAHTGAELEADVESRLVTDAERDADRLDDWFESNGTWNRSPDRSSSATTTAFRSADADAIDDGEGDAASDDRTFTWAGSE